MTFLPRSRTRRPAAILATFLVALVAGCGGGEVEPDPAAQRTPTPVADPGEPTLRDLLTNGSDYVGDEVEITADVSRLLVRATAFTLGDEEQAAGEEEAEDSIKTDADEVPVALLADVDPPEGIAENAVVRVRGTVRTLDAALADEHDLLLEEEGTPDFDALNEFQGGIVILAEEVEVVERPAEHQGEESRSEDQAETGEQPELEPRATPTATPGGETGGAEAGEDTGGAEAPADPSEPTPTPTP